MKSAKQFPRRLFLSGVGGVTLGLPLLDISMPKRASAAAAAQPPFVIIVVCGNGVVQSGKGLDGSTDPERFWPKAPGALTTAGMAAEVSTQASCELSAHASRLLLVRGISHPFAATGCQHASADAQTLTSAQINGTSNKALATGPSVDTFIASSINPPNRAPLALHAGKHSAGGTGFDIPGYVSYIDAKQPRPYVDSPYKAYQTILGVVGNGTAPSTGTGPTQAEQLAVLRSRSVNDVLRGEVKALLARADLSADDRVKLDKHFSAIRDLELQMTAMPTTATVPEASVSRMKMVDAAPYSLANHEALIDLHMQLLVFGVASGYTRVGLLKIGDLEDDSTFTVNGTTFVFHTASHRAIANGASLCSEVDHIHQKYYKGMLDQLAAITTPTGPLVDAGVTVWTNQVANGNHSFTNVPWILAGSAGGYLKQGQFLDVSARKYTTNRMLNTLINAAGAHGANGAPMDSFGDASLTKGVVPEAVA